jgi:hypothetical protein
MASEMPPKQTSAMRSSFSRKTRRPFPHSVVLAMSIHTGW